MKKKITVIILSIILSISIQSAISKPLNKDIKQLNKGDMEKKIEELLEKVNESILYNYIQKFESFGYKKAGSENADKCANYIYDEFESYGLDVYMDSWRYLRCRDKNVLAIKNGTDPSSDAVFLITAHYDTIGESPGANDDGSGIAAMLTIANLTQQYNFNHTIRFIALSGEEAGTYGSHYDAKKSYINDENIIAVFNIDSIGYADSKEDGKLLQNFRRDSSQWIADFTQEISNKYNLDLKLICPGQYPADHESYYDYGFQGIQIIQPEPEKATWFHTPEDTIDKINFTYLIKVTKLTLATIYEIADNPIDIQIRIIAPYEGRIYIRNIPILKLPGFNLFQTRLRGITYIWGKSKMEVEIKTNEEINSVYFKVDGYVGHFCNEPPYEYIIGKGLVDFFSLKHHHIITVVVTTDTGKIAFDEMDVYMCRTIL